jgi:hypothetical protein
MTDSHINFDAPAVLKKWPSLAGERIKPSEGAHPYSIFEGPLDKCIAQFNAKPAKQHCLYEIHTAPQGDLIGPILSPENILDLSRLRDFL